jgi:MFS family permease
LASALSHRGFRILWLGSVLSYTAQWVQQVALGWVAYELTESAALLGLIMSVRAIPMLALAPFSGVAADRYDRRYLLIFGQLIMAAATLSLAIGLVLGVVTPWHLAAFVFITGIAAVVDRNARYAILLDLVPRSDATSAVALNSIAFSGARMGAPAVAGLLLAWLGAAANFFAQGLAYLIAGASLFMIRGATRPVATERRSAWSEMMEGLRFCMRDRVTRLLLLTGVLPYFCFYPVWGVLMPVLAKDVFAVGPSGLGIMLTAIGIGGLLGGFLGSFAQRVRHTARVQLVALGLIAFGLIGVGLAPSMWWALPFAAIGGCGEVVYSVVNQTLLQLAAPAHLRGRITSIMATFPAFISLGALWLGLAISNLGAQLAVGLTGALAAFSAIALLVFAKRLRTLGVADLRAGR